MYQQLLSFETNVATVQAVSIFGNPVFTTFVCAGVQEKKKGEVHPVALSWRRVSITGVSLYSGLGRPPVATPCPVCKLASLRLPGSSIGCGGFLFFCRGVLLWEARDGRACRMFARPNSVMGEREVQLNEVNSDWKAARALQECCEQSAVAL